MTSRKPGRRALVWLVAILLTLVGCGVIFVKGLSWNPPPSKQAKALEHLLQGTPIQDLDVTGLRLLRSASSPGKRTGDGFGQLGQPVTSVRQYAFEGDLTDACQSALDVLLARGWVLEFPEHQSCSDVKHHDLEGTGRQYDRVHIALEYTCGDLTVGGDLSVRLEEEADEPRSLSLVVKVGYPDPDGTGSPDATVQSSCT